MNINLALNLLINSRPLIVFKEYLRKYGEGRAKSAVKQEYNEIKRVAFARRLIDFQPKQQKTKYPEPPIQHPTNSKRVGLMGGRCSPR
jgi:hypothetical protein